MTISPPEGEGAGTVSEVMLDRLGRYLALLGIVFTLLGVLLSPRDSRGHPLLLLPEVQAAMEYRRSASARLAELALLQAQAAQLLAEGDGSLFEQAASGQALLEQAARISGQVEGARIPPAAAAFQRELSAAAALTLDATRAHLEWISAPGEETYQGALDTLARARDACAKLASSPWIAAP